MKNIKVFIIIIISSGLFTLVSGEDVSKVGITAAPFLEIGVGARAIGMGGAFAATSDDASAMYWNPAGIARSNDMQFMFMHTRWFADIDFNYAGFSFPMGNIGSLGAFVTSVNYGDMLVRTESSPDGTGEIFSAADFAVGIHYSRWLTDRFTIGFNAKYIYQGIWHETATGMAVDIGTLFVTSLHGLRIGATLQNFGTDMRMEGKDVLVYHDIDPYIIGNNDRVPANLETESWPLPLVFQFGLAMDLIKNQMNVFTVEVDAVHPYDNYESLNVGAEYSFRKILYLRGGYRDLLLKDAEQGATFGFGLQNLFLGNFGVRIDYAYVHFGRLEDVQHFTLSFIM